MDTQTRIQEISDEISRLEIESNIYKLRIAKDYININKIYRIKQFHSICQNCNANIY